MQLKKIAMAGTLESSDVQVTIEPGGEGIRLELSSSVIRQYGRQIREAVTQTLESLQVANACVRVVDRGALDCTIRARTACAVFRTAEQGEQIPWEVLKL